MAEKKLWDPEFTPAYTPLEMLKKGVFEGKYINALKGLPSSWYKEEKVLGKDDEPDPSINYYGIKSRQPLSVWKKNGWTTKHSPFGWFQWYCLYWLGRRIPKEDEWQIGRWKSFCARHQGQINANCDLKDKECRPKQRQGLLQWAWDSNKEFSDENRDKALKRLQKNHSDKVKLPPKEEEKEGNESWMDF